MANDNGNAVASEMTQAEFLKSLLAGGKLPKGYGSKCLHTFIEESDEPFIDPREVFPLLKDKKVDSIYQLFNSARNDADLDEVVRVKKFDGNVYLIHNERAGTMLDGIEEDDEVEAVEA